MLRPVKKQKQQPKEVPEWKRQMEEDEAREAGSSSSAAPKRDEPASAPSRADADEPPSETSKSSRGGSNVYDLPPDDDDDDEGVDLSNYMVGGGEEEEEVVVQPGSAPAGPSVEERLLAREAADTSHKNKVFYADDNLRSLEKSAGSERSSDRKRLVEMMKGEGAAPPARRPPRPPVYDSPSRALGWQARTSTRGLSSPSITESRAWVSSGAKNIEPTYTGN